MSAGFDAAELATLAGLADFLVPEAEGMPAASAIGISGPRLDEVLNARPELRMPLRQLLRQASGKPPAEFVAALYRDDPEAMHVLGLVVAGGYYLSTEVRKLIGYAGQTRHSYDPDAPLQCLADGTLQRVIDRGPIWRPIT